MNSDERIFLSPPWTDAAERRAVEAAFDSKYIAPCGPMVDEFERRLGSLSGLHAAAVSSGTAALDLLTLNGGNSSGQGIGCISWDGTVYPDQFWRNHPVGNVLEKPFSEIWGDPPPGSLLDLLRRKKAFVKGRCRACRWLGLCGGNFRARGEAVTGDIWGEDPTCYLTDAEIKEEP